MSKITTLKEYIKAIPGPNGLDLNSFFKISIQILNKYEEILLIYKKKKQLNETVVNCEDIDPSSPSFHIIQPSNFFVDNGLKLRSRFDADFVPEGINTSSIDDDSIQYHPPEFFSLPMQSIFTTEGQQKVASEVYGFGVLAYYLLAKCENPFEKISMTASSPQMEESEVEEELGSPDFSPRSNDSADVMKHQHTKSSDFSTQLDPLKVAAAHMAGTPKKLCVLRPDVPKFLSKVINQCLDKVFFLFFFFF